MRLMVLPLLLACFLELSRQTQPLFTMPPSRDSAPPVHSDLSADQDRGIAHGSGPDSNQKLIQPVLPDVLRVSPSVLRSLASSETPIPYTSTVRGAGTVLLKVVISKAGQVQELAVVQGTPDFRRAALDGVKSWKYRPYLINGEPHRIQSTISLYFAGKGTAGVRPPR
jgi:TonB family protein